MKTYKVNTWFGTYDVFAEVSEYRNNGNLAIQLVTADMEPFARLTVNLDKKLPSDMAYVDTNNCPWAEEFIEENGLGYATDDVGMSGWCFYPAYRFDMEKLNGKA